MTLPLPTLDSRTFDQLVAEGRALIPRHAAEWTDHNAHDVGITLIEFIAWLTEMNLFRLDRIPESTQRVMLRLAGVTPRPSEAAQTVLEFQIAAGTVPIVLPANLKVASAAGVVFQTVDKLTVAPARITNLVAVGVDFLESNRTDGASYLPFGLSPGVDDALVLGFDQPLPSQPLPISIYAWTPSYEEDWNTRHELIEEWEAETASGSDRYATCPVPDWRDHYAIRTRWEYFSPIGWKPLTAVVDETRALSLSGFVTFQSPPDMALGGPFPAAYGIRCRIVSGQFDCPPVLQRIAINATLARHQEDIRAEHVGTGDGRAAQRLQVKGAPVVPRSARLQVDAETWREVAEWEGVGPHDRVFRLAPDTGEIWCGNGRIGRVFPDQSPLVIDYQTGGGTIGNLAARSLVSAGRSDVTVLQPQPAFGGRKAETLREAQRRVQADWEHTRRAVTLRDFEKLTLETPGAPVARTQALAEFHPDWPTVSAAGCVTVVILPRSAGARPTPTDKLLGVVQRYLERRRLITAEVHVIGPCYEEVSVYATLHVDPHTDSTKLSQRAAKTLDAFLHPLTGGPDGAGWPVGRDVYRSEVIALLGALDGVAFIDNFGLAGEHDSEPRCGNLTIGPQCLTVSGEHRLRVVERKTK